MDHVQPRKNKNNIYVKLLTLSGCKKMKRKRIIIFHEKQE